MSFQKTLTWLKVASAIVVGFGLLIAIGASPAGSAVMSLFMDIAFWPVDSAQSVSGAEMRLLSAVSGGMMAGWGVLLWQVSTRVFPHDPGLGRNLILSSIGAWFVIDSIGSIVAGAPLNALFNVGFLALFFVPLWRPVREAPG